jgi:hypothetical protein
MVVFLAFNGRPVRLNYKSFYLKLSVDEPFLDVAEEEGSIVCSKLVYNSRCHCYYIYYYTS